jgi:uncharacterized lipoprotein YmbA
MKRSIWSLVVLAGCASSPAPHWHSLVPAAPATPAAAATSGAAPARQTLVVSSIAMPDEVDRPLLVVRSAAGAPALLDGERWSEPLKAQLPRALALALTPRLPATLVTAAPGGTVVLPTWRLAVDVQRFELQRGPDRAVLRVVWALRPGGVRDGTAPAAPAPQVFDTAVPAAGGGTAALVAAMGTALEQLSGQISQSVCAAGPC